MFVAGSGETCIGNVDLGQAYRRGVETHLNTGTDPRNLRRVGVGTSLAMLIAPEVFLDPLAHCVDDVLYRRRRRLKQCAFLQHCFRFHWRNQAARVQDRLAHLKRSKLVFHSP